MKPAVYDAIWSAPPSVAPSTPVRYWGPSLLAGAVAFGLAYAGVGALAYQLPGAPPNMLFDLWGGLATGFHWLTAALFFEEAHQQFIGTISEPWNTGWRLGLGWTTGLTAGAWTLRRALVPRASTWHIKGPRLLEGEQARKEARSRSAHVAPGAMLLHPDLRLSKPQWSRHALIYGSVGSGKTQVLLPIVAQMISANHKALIYDIKGDFTAAFARPIVCSPFDRRSYVWDIAADVRTPTQAAALAISLIPEDQGSGKYWSVSAQQLVIGVIRALQNERGTAWGFPDLARGVAQSAEQMLPMLQEHYAKAAPLVANAESTSTASLLATLATYTRVIDDLAMAWPTVGKRRFSISEWVRDDYTGRRQILVQAGQDPALTRAYIAAMVNVAVSEIISPALPDDERGRFLGFVLDELPSIGRINIGPLIDKGRSKGVVFLGGLQDLAQLREVYGENMAKAMTSMVGTHVICQMQIGESRDQLAAMLGRHRVAWRTHDAGAQVHEESRALISGGELTDRLGPRKGKQYGPHGFGVRAIVQMGGDPLLLDFPGVVLPKVREGQVPATWTTRPAGTQRRDPEPLTRQPTASDSAQTQQVLGLTEDQINAIFQWERT